MNPAIEAFTVVSSAWLEVIRSMIPGGSATPDAETAPKAAPAVAVQTWEDEGGSTKPETPASSPRP